jgi:hypothetical protein
VNSFRPPNQVSKIGALMAANLILPVLAHAQATAASAANAPLLPIRAVPEAKPGLALIPFVGAVLLLSVRHLFRAKAGEKNGC